MKISSAYTVPAAKTISPAATTDIDTAKGPAERAVSPAYRVDLSARIREIQDTTESVKDFAVWSDEDYADFQERCQTNFKDFQKGLLEKSGLRLDANGEPMGAHALENTDFLWESSDWMTSFDLDKELTADKGSVFYTPLHKEAADWLEDFQSAKGQIRAGGQAAFAAYNLRFASIAYTGSLLAKDSDAAYHINQQEAMVYFDAEGMAYNASSRSEQNEEDERRPPLPRLHTHPPAPRKTLDNPRDADSLRPETENNPDHQDTDREPAEYFRKDTGCRKDVTDEKRHTEKAGWKSSLPFLSEAA